MWSINLSGSKGRVLTSLLRARHPSAGRLSAYEHAHDIVQHDTARDALLAEIRLMPEHADAYVTATGHADEDRRALTVVVSCGIPGSAA